MSEKARYFPAIDGLRAIAVVSVLFFHLGGLLPSGFVGVDVFFVISGFVVTLASESLPKGKLSGFLLAFYGRRLQRIFPAAIVCILVTFLLLVLFIPVAPDGRLTEANTKTGLAAFFGFGNVVLAQSLGDYWSPRTELNPFTHTWSLGVEEQFYFVFPTLAFLWLARRRTHAPILVVLLCIASCIWAAIASGRGPFAFYSLVTRFWELGIGVLLALSIRKWSPVAERNPGRLFTAIGCLGFTGIVAAVLVADSAKFPWPWALLPVAATSAVILAGATENATNPIARVLACSHMVWLGKRSFSLYLWHWPVIVLIRWTTGLETVAELSLALVASFALTVWSYRFVELPVRNSVYLRNLSRPKLVLLFLFGVSLAAALAATLAYNRARLTLSVTSDPLDWRWDGTLPSSNSACESSRTFEARGAGRLMKIDPMSACPDDGRTLYVAGDSHAGAYVAMLDLFARDSGWKVRIYSMPGCGVYELRRTTAQVSAECNVFVSAVMSEIARVANNGDSLFLPGLRLPRYADQWGPVTRKLAAAVDIHQEQAVVAEAFSALKPVSQAGVQIVFEGPKPVFKAPLFRCSDPFNRTNPICRAGFEVPRSEIEALRKPIIKRMGYIAENIPQVTIWDPIDLLCDDAKCRADRAGRPVFFDGDHISGFGNRLLSNNFRDFMLRN